MSEAASEIEIHQLNKLGEFAEVVRLQREIWGFQDVELLPQRLFVVASKIGGQVLGAFDGGKMVAFCLCIPGLKPGGKYYFHSHMLGVLPAYRNTGLGRRMKLEQRHYALEAGVDLIEWTFDPLEIKNAFFNIERLGAIVRRYVHNQYGTTSSHLHGGLPTDRLVPEWWIRSERVERLLAGEFSTRATVEARIAVPADIAEIRKSDPARAREIQLALAGQFDEHFRAGLAVTGFERSAESGTYLLTQWPSK
ncbi:MAG TPA: GNAT family N-acetyltransferase [Bryobacteraceae bacterium]|nr:GNAT family N-acetyltransferase [Bryobacteraceae bacterium]